MLLANGAAVNQVKNNGYTPLMMSSGKGHVEVVKLLLAYGANVNQAAKGGVTALIMSSNFRHPEVAKLLLANGARVGQTEAEKKEEKEKEKARVCQKCGKGAEKMQRCAGCRLARYCSPECQRGDRKAHKAECKRVSSSHQSPPHHSSAYDSAEMSYLDSASLQH